MKISDFGLTKGVLGKMPLHLAMKVSFRAAHEEIYCKNIHLSLFSDEYKKCRNGNLK